MTTLEELLPLLTQLSTTRDRRRSLAEMAREASRSPSSFQRSFKRLVHESPKQFTRRLQLECAAAMLIGGRDSVLDVALACGFDSHEGFTRAFASHFGQPPRSFRRAAQAVGLDRELQQTELLLHVGPCVGLFRAPLETRAAPSPKGNVMSYDITRQSTQPLTLLCKQARCAHADIGETLAKILPSIFVHVTSHQIQMAGPPTTLYVEWGPGMVTLKAGMPVVPGTEGTDEIEAVVLPAGECATTVHTGAYDGLGDAHAALEVYVENEGLVRDGPLREVYLTDPGEVPNPEDWKTQILWPVRAR